MGKSSGGHCCSKMANSDMVACAGANVDQQPNPPRKRKNTADSSWHHSKDSPPISQTGTVDVPLVWRSLEIQGISAEASRLIIRSSRSGTASQYQAYYKKWEMFCCQRNINPLQITLQDGINFLAKLFGTGVGYSCTNTARSVLSWLCVLPGSIQFGSH